MAAQKLAPAQRLTSIIYDLALRAAGISYQRIGPDERVEMANRIQNPADGG
jgi:putative cell wall-binding protein